MTYQMRMQADDFYKAYQVLKDNYNTKTLAIMGPSIVCLAFSVELYMKDLHFALEGKAPFGHNIYKLFKKLPEPIRQEIFSHPSISQNPFHTRGHIYSAKGFSSNFNPYDGFIEQIEIISDAFVNWRYPIDQKKTVTLTYNSAFAEALAEAVKSVADNLRRQTVV